MKYLIATLSAVIAVQLVSPLVFAASSEKITHKTKVKKSEYSKKPKKKSTPRTEATP